MSRLLERKPSRRLGMGPGGVEDVRRHRWFDSMDWDALQARRVKPPRQPKDDSAKRLKDLVVRTWSLPAHAGLASRDMDNTRASCGSACKLVPKQSSPQRLGAMVIDGCTCAGL